VDILRLLGLLCRFPQPGYEEAESMAHSFSLWVHEITGLPQPDLFMAIERLADNKGLDGFPDPDDAYNILGKTYGDLRQVAAPLHELDRDGTTAHLWRKLCRRWPIFREYHAQLHAGAAGDSRCEAATDTNPPEAIQSPADQRKDPTPTDGTILDSHIWLKGKAYRLTPRLRDLAAYLLANNGATQDAVIRHCGFSGASHLHKRLKNLRDQLAKDLKQSGWRLHIKTVEARVYCEWREGK
jgi:hypothetical protein